MRCTILALLLASGVANADVTARWTGKAVEVVGFAPDTFNDVTAESLPSVAFVKVDGTPDELRDRPALLGTWTAVGDGLSFAPRFPLRAGVTYRVSVSPGPGKPSVVTFALPAKEGPAAAVTAVYPSADEVPENLLKMYLHFSVPMSRGEAYRHTQLLDAKGKVVEGAFLQLEEELWDREGMRLTLLFDPGRIKKEVKPREDLGPCLEAGKAYTLEIAAAWRDAEGRPLKAGFKKSFRAAKADETPPEPKAWKVTAAAGARRGVRRKPRPGAARPRPDGRDGGGHGRVWQGDGR